MFENYITKTGLLSSKQPQHIKNRWYIEKFRKVHGDKYDYSSVEYTSTHEKVEIICENHGRFWQTPHAHLRGQGCPGCYQSKKVKTTEDCIESFTMVHGDIYDYSKVAYIGNRVNVEIICKEHGSFLQRPDNHLQGKGCPKCQHQNQDTLYILKCKSTGLYKIGITNHLNQRINNIGGKLEYIFHIGLENPRVLEKCLHQRYQDCNVFNDQVNNGGTEFFSLSDQQVEELICFLSQHQDQ